MLSPILPFLVLVGLGAGLSADASQGVVGTWEFVSATTTQADGTTIEHTTHDLRSTKILNENYFCVVTRNADGTFRHTNLGPYRVEGDLYTETLEYSTNRDWMGGEAAYRFRIEGDLWYIDEIGLEPEKRGEVWRRVSEPRAAVEF